MEGGGCTQREEEFVWEESFAPAEVTVNAHSATTVKAIACSYGLRFVSYWSSEPTKHRTPAEDNQELPRKRGNKNA